MRCRPMSSSEKEKNCEKIVVIDQKNCTVALKKPKSQSAKGAAPEPPKSFRFDHVYDDDSKQRQVSTEHKLGRTV